MQQQRSDSPEPDCVSMKSDESKDLHDVFKDGQAAEGRMQQQRSDSPEPSCVSMKSDESKDLLVVFKDGQPADGRFRNISSKYKNIISKRRLLHQGSPSIYQLKPKKETFGTLTKLTFGERDVNKINKTILLVGETGAGKSTLVNALVNHTMGVEMEDEVWFQILEQEEKKSQTSDVIVYEVFGFEGETLPYSLTIIDTPGFGDIRGAERDNIVTQRLLDWFRSDDGVNEINAVGLVMKVGINRLNDRLKYVIDSVMSLFGKNMEKNIIALITHSDGTHPENVLEALEAANIKCATNEDDDPVHFLFNNCQNKQRTEEEEEELENPWRVTDRGMKQFMTLLEITGPQKLNTTVKVLKEREQLITCIQNLEDRIKTIEKKQKDIRQNEEALKKHEDEMKKNEEFTVEVDEVYKDKKPIKGGMWGFGFYEGAVTCNVCQENCHYPGCTMARSPAFCKVMKDGRCTACTGQCPAEDHVKEEMIYVNKTKKVKKTLNTMKQKYEENLAENDKKTLEDMKQKYEENLAENDKTLEDMKQKYEENLAKSQEKSSLLESLKTEMILLEADKTRFLEKAYQHVVNLEKIALKADSVSTYVHLDLLIEKMKEKGDRGKVQKLEEMKKRQDEGNKGAVQYVLGGMKSAGKTMTGWMK